ncbi:Phage-related protein [Vibrio cholerae]|nr:Phage-related protein [Vibrio cholerae]
MKVVPMIFNTDMVKALMAGHKVVTRRPAKNLSFSERVGFIVGEWAYGIGWNLRETMNNCIRSKSAKCPSKIGDLIYVRETFRLFNHSDECGCSDYCSCPPSGTPVYFANCGGDSESKWKPSIHMPRAASRLTLKVTDVRVERVQDITEEQCWKEGVEHIDGQFDIHQLSEMAKTFDGTFEDAKALFACLWDSIYQNWKENPYVWVIEFEVIHQNVDKYLESVKEVA